MMLFRKTNVQNVSEWLEATTRKLAPAAQERVRLEIEAHHAESMAAHVQAGLSKNDAEAAALAELGDVRQAARRFSRQYLTARQARNLEAWDKNSRSLRQLAIYHALFFMFALYLSRTLPIFAARLPLLFLFLVALPTSAFFLARSKGGYPNGWLCALIRSCNGHQLGMLFLFAFLMRPDVDLPNAGLPMDRFDYWGTLVLQLMFALQGFDALRFAKKLHDLQNYPERPVSS
jgi:hypothetical protein